MTQAENKLLNDFVGIRFHDNSTVSFYPTCFNLKMGVSVAMGINYHEDWNKLMHVATKVKELTQTILAEYNNELLNGDKSINEKRNEFLRLQEHLTWALLAIDIDMIYSAVIQFIQWYNQHK